MTSYPPTPAFGGFPIPALRGPPGLSQDLRKLSINSAGSSNTTLPSPAIQPPNYLPKFPNNISASRQPLPIPPSNTSMHAPEPRLNILEHKRDDGLPEDREEGELSDAEDLEESNVNLGSNNSGSKQQDRSVQNQQAREFTSLGLKPNGEIPNHLPFLRSQTWNEPYRRESVSQGWGQQSSNRNKTSDLSSVGPPKAPRGERYGEKFDPPSQPKGMGNEKSRAGNYRDRKLSGSGNIPFPPSGPKNQSPSYHSTPASRGTQVNNSSVHVSVHQSQLETPKTAAEFRSEAQRAVLNMLPLKVTFKYMVEEAGIDANVLKKVFTGIGLPLPTETPSPSPSGDIDYSHRVVAKHKAREKSSDKMEIDKEAQSIRKQLEKDARDRERREAEAKAAELVRQREAAKAEDEKKKRLAEVEAKKEVLRRKIDEMKLPGKSASPGTPLTPISSTPIMEAIARAPAVLLPRPEVPRIPGLLLGQLDGCYSDTPSPPGVIPDQRDTTMKDSPEPVVSHSAGNSALASNISTTPAATQSPERLLTQRRKRPVASDMYSEPMPTTKRKFGDQRKVPIELIINISEEEEDDDEEEEEDEEGEDGSEHTGDDSRTSRSTPSGTDLKKTTANGNNSPRLRSSNTVPTGGVAINGTHSKLDSAKALQDKEEQIRALKEAIQKAQKMKKMRAKTGMSTPTSVGTPDIGTGPSVPPPLAQQQQVTDVVVVALPALDTSKKEDKITRQREKKQEILLAQAVEAKVKADAIKLRESHKKEKEEKMKTLLTEINEMEKLEAEIRKKKAKEAEQKRRKAKEEMEWKLKQAEDEREKSKMALMKIQQEYERMQREASEMEGRKEALKAELAAMEKAAEQTVDAMGESDEAASQAISKKKEEIEQLKKTMEESEVVVDQTTCEVAISSVSSSLDSHTASLPDLHLEPDNQENHESRIDVVMVDNVETKANRFVVGTDRQPQETLLQMAGMAASPESIASFSLPVDALGDAMELDQVGSEGKLGGNKEYTDFDMDALSDEEGSQKDSIIINTEPENDAGGTPVGVPDGKTGEQSASGPGPTSYSRAIGGTAVEEEMNLPSSVPEHGKHVGKLMDPTKITSTTATTSDTKKPSGEETPRQLEHFFTPYKSPLTNFKSFRYHPNFLEFCPGGYKSLTFSNRIDPLKPLCRWELSGGICSDTSCIGQHQKQFEVPDDEILVELASVVEGSNEEERNNYNRGLRQAIAAMREQGIKDFQTVVAGIASYRRRFLGDETRVLRLPYPPTAPTRPPSQQQRLPSSFSSYT